MSTQNLKEQVKSYVDDYSPQITALADEIWDYAEVRFEVPRSANAHKDLLRQAGFELVEEPAKIPNSFVASLGSGEPKIGFLLEYDALAGFEQAADVSEKCVREDAENPHGHGCGHHMLGAAGTGAALALAKLYKEENLPGTILAFGCPAEEVGYGKAHMARAGIFDQADALLTWHPMSENAIWGQSSLASIQMYFDFTGVSAHAGANPWDGRSALDAAELMNIGTQFLREHAPDTARIHYAFMDVGGESANVVQPTASLHYIIRAEEQSQAKDLAERVKKIAEGAALMTETEVSIRFDAAAANYIVNATLAELVYANLVDVGLPQFDAADKAYMQDYFASLPEQVKDGNLARYKNIFPEASSAELERMATSPINEELTPFSLPDKPMTASTDVGNASWIRPTAQFTLAYGPNGSSPHSWQWVAVGKSPAAHKVLITASKILATSALDLLLDPELVAKAKAEHQENIGPAGYESNMPTDFRPFD